MVQYLGRFHVDDCLLAMVIRLSCSWDLKILWVAGARFPIVNLRYPDGAPAVQCQAPKLSGMAWGICQISFLGTLMSVSHAVLLTSIFQYVWRALCGLPKSDLLT